MRSFHLIKGIFLSVLLFTSGWVVYYYWSVDSLDAIRRLPTEVMVLCIVYVLVQILKRLASKERNWWDWLYYIGLISAMLPTLMASEKSVQLFHFITDYGTLFLIIPVLFDTYHSFKRKK